MNDNPQFDHRQIAILALLAQEWENVGPPGIVDLINMARYLGLPLDEIRKIVNPMFESGVLDVDQLGTAAYLTPEGYEQARKHFAP